MFFQLLSPFERSLVVATQQTGDCRHRQTLLCVFFSLRIQEKFATAFFSTFKLQSVKCVFDNLVYLLVYENFAATTQAKRATTILLKPCIITLFAKKARTSNALNWLLHNTRTKLADQVLVNRQWFHNVFLQKLNL